MYFIDQLQARFFKQIQNENMEMRIVTGNAIINHHANDRKPEFSKYEMKLMRTKSLPTIKSNINNELRKRSLDIYSETLFDLSVY